MVFFYFHNTCFQEKNKIEALSTNFYLNFIQNAIPTIKKYIDDLMFLVDEKEEQRVMMQHNHRVMQLFNSNTPILHYPNDPMMETQLSKKMMKEFLNSLYSVGNLDCFIDSNKTECVLQELVQNFNDNCSISDSFWCFNNKNTEAFEQSLQPQLTETSWDLIKENSPTLTDLVKSDFKGN
jgi:hypothetical protein